MASKSGLFCEYVEGKVCACDSSDWDCQGEGPYFTMSNNNVENKLAIANELAQWLGILNCGPKRKQHDQQDQPSQWRHASLGKLEDFLEQQIANGSFQPTFRWVREF